MEKENPNEFLISNFNGFFFPLLLFPPFTINFSFRVSDRRDVAIVAGCCIHPEGVAQWDAVGPLGGWMRRGRGGGGRRG